MRIFRGTISHFQYINGRAKADDDTITRKRDRIVTLGWALEIEFDTVILIFLRLQRPKY